MPLSPKAPVASWLVDFDVGVSLFIYDDRGMDVRALWREALDAVYRQFDAWLLDHDRARMTAAFG